MEGKITIPLVSAPITCEFGPVLALDPRSAAYGFNTLGRHPCCVKEVGMKIRNVHNVENSPQRRFLLGLVGLVLEYLLGIVVGVQNRVLLRTKLNISYITLILWHNEWGSVNFFHRLTSK